MLLCAFFSHSVLAQRLVKPGEVISLAPEEAFFLLAVQSDSSLHGVRVVRQNRYFDSGVKHRHPGGRSYGLYVAAAGDYQWSSIEHFPNWQFKLRDDPEFKFSISSGRINYPGDLLFVPRDGRHANMSVYNRGLKALDWLQANHPELLQNYPLEFAGRYPDPFPGWYQALLKSQGGSAPGKQADIDLRPPAEVGDLPFEPQAMWKHDYALGEALSPDGRFVALYLRDQPERWSIEVIDLKNGERRVAATSPLSFPIVQWSGDRRLVLQTGNDYQRIIEMIQIGIDDQDKADFRSVRLRGKVRVVDSLPMDPDHVLVASHSRRGQLMIHKVNMRDQNSVDAFKAVLGERLNKWLSNDLYWLTDAEGDLRLGVVRRKNKVVLMHGRGSSFNEVQFEDPESDFTPYSLSPDGEQVYGFSEDGRSQRDLVVFDIATARIGKTLFSKEGVDVVAPVLDQRRNVIGASYYFQGRLVNEFFAQREQQLDSMLRRAFPDRSIRLAARSDDGNQQLFWVDGPDRPAQLFHVDLPARRVSPLLDRMPWLAELKFASAKHLRVPLPDGELIDAFLTFPIDVSTAPLIVFPHGGPIGVADTLHFNEEVQFLAAQGYAVLQVNFRGSDGYGRAFREAGHRNFGRLIEDDIDAAIKYVVATEAVDEKRMCMLGTSYGGYSALIAAARWPQRFSCVVSISGVTDMLLQLSATDGAQTAAAREVLERIIGDPRTQLEEIRANSPVYQASRISVPVFMAHGLKDRRVDPEHAQRMLRVLHLYGRAPEGLWLEDEGHGLNYLDNFHVLWGAVAGFLHTHLGKSGEAAPP